MLAAALLVAPSILAALISLGIALQRPPWFDELFTTWAVNLPPADLAHFVLQDRDAVHSLYYFAMNTYAELVGGGILALRLPSVVGMAAACVAVTLLLREIAGRTAALVGGFSFALLPLTWDFGAEARGFAIATALAAWASFVLVLQATRGPTRGRWIVYVALITLAGYVFLWAWLVVAAHLLFVALPPRGDRRQLRGFLQSLGASLLLLAPLTVLAVGQRHQVAWLTNHRPLWAQQTLGFPFGEGGARSALGGAVLLALLVVGTVYASRTASWTPLLRRAYALGWAWALGPALILWVASFVQPLFTLRYLTISGPGIAVLIGLVLSLTPNRWLVAAGVIGVIAASTALTSRDWTLGRDGWRDKEAALQANALAGDGVYMHAKARAGARLQGLISPQLVDVGPVGWRSPARDAANVTDAAGWPDVVWLVPLDCPTQQDLEALAGRGYRQDTSADVGRTAEGLCPVQRWVRP